MKGVVIEPDLSSNVKFLCKLQDAMVQSPCAAVSCMYFKRNEANFCGYSKITEIASNLTLPREKRRQALERIFRVDPVEFEVALRRVVSIVCLNEYFQYVYSKSLLDAKSKELQHLKTDPLRYQEWRPASRKVRFTEIQDTIEFVIANIK